MTIAICDDNRTDAQYLVSLIKGMHSTRIFSSAEELLFELEEENVTFDLYLLDIFMEKMNGISLGERIRELSEKALICYISTSPDYYAEAFSIYAFQYLVKPVSREALYKLLERAAQQFSHDTEQSLQVNARHKYISIPYRNILYLSSMGHTILIHCKNGSVQSYTGRLDDLLLRLDPTVFARCHQSYIVNLYNISALEGDFFICGTQQIPISRRYAEIKKSYRELLFSDLD